MQRGEGGKERKERGESGKGVKGGRKKMIIIEPC